MAGKKHSTVLGGIANTTKKTSPFLQSGGGGGEGWGGLAPFRCSAKPLVPSPRWRGPGPPEGPWRGTQHRTHPGHSRAVLTRLTSQDWLKGGPLVGTGQKPLPQRTVPTRSSHVQLFLGPRPPS